MGVPVMKYFSLLRKYLRPYRLEVISLTFVMLSDIVLSILNPQIIRIYLDQATRGTKAEILQQAALLYILLAVVQQIFGIGSVYLSQKVSWGSTNLLRSDILYHTMKLDMSFHNKYKPGDLIERVDGDVNALSNFFSRLVLLITSNVLLIVGILIVIFIESIKLGVAFTIFTLVGFTVTYYVRKLVVPYFKKMREANMHLYGFLEEYLQGTEDITALGMESYVRNKHLVKEKEKYDTTIRAIIYSRILNISFNGLIAFGSTLVFVLGVPMFQRGEISIGSLFILNYYVTLLINPIIRILTQIQTLQRADASIERIEELLHIKSKIEDNGTYSVPDSGHRIEFEDVCFSYETDDVVLNNMNFTIEDGTKLGIIGRTGSGKTTISRLIYRFYDPSKGRITLANRDLRDYQLQNLRKSIGVVTQDVQIFRASIRQNITFFNDRYRDEIIEKTIRDVGLWDWYKEQQDGLDTTITENQLSAGQAQLLSVARLFLKDPKIVILDEASSRLDPVTEQMLDQAIQKLLEGKTAIIIAHRLSTLNKVDYILNIRYGELIEYGKREELGRDPTSEYANMLLMGKEKILT